MGRRLPWECLDAVITLIALICFPAVAAESAEESSRRPKLGLVLSGGGARGAAHVGVLKVLEEMRIPVDFIAGTSMGAIVGGLYASGLSPEELDRILGSTDWNDLFTDRPSREHLSFRRKEEDLESLIKIELGWKKGITFPRSLIAGDKLIFFLRKLSLQTQGISNFDELPIPFRAVATDVETGDLVVLGKGDFAQALRATMAIPGVFAPQELDGRLLVDGFLTQNLPVSLARERDVDAVIAVDVGAPLYARDELQSIFKFTDQMLGMTSRKNTKEQVALLRANDVLIQPELGSIRGVSFDRATETIALGIDAAQKARNSLQRYSVPEAEYERWRGQHRRTMRGTMRIDAVQVENTGRISKKTVERRAGIKPGEEVSINEVRRTLDRIYDIGAFDLVDFQMRNEGGTNTLVIQPLERSSGLVHIRAGLHLFSDLDGDSDFNFLTSVRAAELNQLGAEWKNQIQFGRTVRLFSEWYQPLEYSRSLFVAPRVEFLQDRVETISGDTGLVRGKYRLADGGFDVGTQLSNYGELRVGPIWGWAEIYDLRGTPLPDNPGDFSMGGGHVRFALDQLDNVDFPRKGYVAVVDFSTSREELGASLDYNRITLGWHHALSFGENTFVPGVTFGAKLGPDLPFYELFDVGGFLNLSGYPFQGLSDQYAGVARMVYYRRLWRFNKGFLDAIYLGGSVETGGAWHRIEDVDSENLIFAGSAFVGADTLFGPLYLAYGQAEGGNHAFYFYLGRGF